MDKFKWRFKFADRLREKIDAKGYTICDLGARADIAPANIYAYLDALATPNAITVNKLASALDCTTDDLININLYED